MAVKASATVTLNFLVDVKAVYRYYKLQSSTAAAPTKPADNKLPDSSWSLVEPAYQNGSTNTLYTVDLTVFTDDKCSYSDVSKSSSYEAAKQAYNAAINAQSTANSAQNAVDNLEIGGRNLVLNTTDEWSDWITPTANMNNYTLNVGYLYLPENKQVGDTYTCQIEIEFSDVAAGVGGAFSIRSQGAVDDMWDKANIWNPLYLVSPPENGVYRYITVEKIQKTAVNSTKFNLGFRCNYWDGTGKFRYRKVKIEKGNKATDWTPAPEDIQQDISAVDKKLDAKVSIDDLASKISAVAETISLSGGQLEIDMENFKLTPEGAITATSGTIGGNALDATSIFNRTFGMSSNPSRLAFWAGETNYQYGSVNSNAKFKVTQEGMLDATDVHLKGEIESTFGRIGNVRFKNNLLSYRDIPEVSEMLDAPVDDVGILSYNRDTYAVANIIEKYTYLTSDDSLILTERTIYLELSVADLILKYDDRSFPNIDMDYVKNICTNFINNIESMSSALMYINISISNPDNESDSFIYTLTEEDIEGITQTLYDAASFKIKISENDEWVYNYIKTHSSDTREYTTLEKTLDTYTQMVETKSVCEGLLLTTLFYGGGVKTLLLSTDSSTYTNDEIILGYVGTQANFGSGNADVAESIDLNRVMSGIKIDKQGTHIMGNLDINSTKLDTYLLNKIYPVGSIYISTNNTSPATLFGGTWEQIKDRFLLAAGSTYSSGSTGGSATHTLTTNELPSHSHSVNAVTAASNGAHTHSVNAVTSGSNGAHSHKLGRNQNSVASGSKYDKPNNYSSSGDTGYTSNSTGAHTHSVPAHNTNSAGAHTHSVPAHNTNATGSNTAHNNMPPYYTVYMWKRTA